MYQPLNSFIFHVCRENNSYLTRKQIFVSSIMRKSIQSDVFINPLLAYK